jgi:hypothetical protein
VLPSGSNKKTAKKKKRERERDGDQILNKIKK